MYFSNKIICALGLFFSVHTVFLTANESSYRHHESRVQKEKQYYKKLGITLIGLGLLGNCIGAINAVSIDKDSFLYPIKKWCGYPFPEFSGDLGFARYINNFCSEFWQKSLFFTLVGIVPGIALLIYSYKLSVNKKPSDKKVKG